MAEACLPSWNDGGVKSAILDFVTRKFSYDRVFEYGVTVGGMKEAWKSVFPKTTTAAGPS